MSISKRHNVFVSYHHDNDQSYRNHFEEMFSNQHDIMVSKSVQIGDINSNLSTDAIRQKIRDEYLRDSTVTVVLIGAKTWQRKHVDWEIGSSLRHTEYNNRSGVIGILLPSYPKDSWEPEGYSKHTIPPRLASNLEIDGFSKIYDWSYDASLVQSWIHDAFKRRTQIDPDNSYPSFVNNRTGDRWY